MSDRTTKRAREIYLELSTLDENAVNAELDRLAGDDPELREAVISLIDAEARADRAGFMSSPTASTTAMNATITETAGTVIGRYKLLQLIGEGGFGSVFLAEQARPVRRRVALKIIKLGMDTKQVIARFEAERQALAMMDHPHIARVYDAGATDTGRPYFAMEYVVGDAITKFADAHKLNIPERLALFAQVCSAVQHAHTKGVIHRDLKPANVLVSMVDGKPYAKVIDFGIAKATSSPLTEKTLFTEHRQLIGTPEYMSPEQAEGSPDIDTRTDVYALGVLLYELLTGVTPFDAKRLLSAGFGEMQRIIKEEDPPAPSMRLTRNLETLAQTAMARQVEPAKLSTAVRGELDWIVMKSLDKDRGRRYESAAQLAVDIANHLAGEAVVAAPPSRGYRVRKFVRRNKGAVIAGSAVSTAILLGLAGTAWGWLAAKQANIQLQQDRALARETMIDILVATTEFDDQERADLMASEGLAEIDAKRVQATAYAAGATAVHETELSEIGQLALFANRTVTETVALRDTLQTQAEQAQAGAGKMLSILTDGATAGPIDTFDPDTGVSLFESDPLGTTIGYGIQFAESLKEERDRLQRQNEIAIDSIADAVIRIMESDLALDASPSLPGDTGTTLVPTWSGPAGEFSLNKSNLADGTTAPLEPDEVLPAMAEYLSATLSYAIETNAALLHERDRLRNHADIARDGLAEMSRILYECDCDPQDAPQVGEAYISAWISFHGDQFPDDSPDELRLRALMSYATGNAEKLVAESDRSSRIARAVSMLGDVQNEYVANRAAEDFDGNLAGTDQSKLSVLLDALDQGLLTDSPEAEFSIRSALISLMETSNRTDAIAFCQETLAQAEELFGPEHPITIRTLTKLVSMHDQSFENPEEGLLAEARRWYGELRQRIHAVRGDLPEFDTRQWANTLIDFSSQYSDTSWTASMVLGEPDAFSYTDHRGAWTPKTGSRDPEHVTVGFDEPVHATGVVVREVLNNGFVRLIEVIDLGGELHPVWAGEDTSEKGVPYDFVARFERTPFAVRGVRVTIDGAYATNWEEIDAIELLGYSLGDEILAADEQARREAREQKTMAMEKAESLVARVFSSAPTLEEAKQSVLAASSETERDQVTSMAAFYRARYELSKEVNSTAIEIINRFITQDRCRDELARRDDLSPLVRDEIDKSFEIYASSDPYSMYTRIWRVVHAPGASRETLDIAHDNLLKIVDDNPNDRDYMRTYGVALYRLGDYNLALEILTKPNSLFSYDWGYLSMIYAKLGKTEEAIEAFDRWPESLRTADSDTEAGRIYTEMLEVLGPILAERD